MKADTYDCPDIDAEAPKRERKAGRPRAIPTELEPVVIALYQEEYGYRAIARILRKEHLINPHFSSVRQTLKRLGLLQRNFIIAVG